MSTPDDMNATAAHLRITELDERVGQLDGREDDHFSATAAQVQRLDESRRETDGNLTELARVIADHLEDPNKPHLPEPSIRWWELDDGGADREDAIADLQAWIQNVYQPGFGHLAAALPPCWAQHDLCLYILDVLSQFWMVLWLNPGRSAATVAGQADLLTRVMPQMVGIMQTEGKNCAHAKGRLP
jgi:hypothetical protein